MRQRALTSVTIVDINYGLASPEWMHQQPAIPDKGEKHGSLSGKVAWVTGAGTGIGLAGAQALAQAARWW